MDMEVVVYDRGRLKGTIQARFKASVTRSGFEPERRRAARPQNAPLAGTMSTVLVVRPGPLCCS